MAAGTLVGRSAPSLPPFPMTRPGLLIVHDAGTTTVEPGSSVTFGRRTEPGVTPTDHPHLGLSPNPRLHAHAGTIAADDAGWTLANTGRWLHIRVSQVDGPNRSDLEPGRTLRVPWARTRVEVVTGDELVAFDVECAVLSDAPGDSVPALSGDTVGGLGLDRSAGYFRALVGLCEPRLRDPSSDAVATTAEIARALNRVGVERDRVTAKAVERRLAHVRSRLGIGGDDPHGISAAGLEVRDASRQLADLVLRTGTVTPDDLALLAPADDEASS